MLKELKRICGKMSHIKNKFLKGLEELGAWRLNFKPSIKEDNKIVVYGSWLKEYTEYYIIFNINGKIDQTYNIKTKEFRKLLNKNTDLDTIIQNHTLSPAIDLFPLEEPFVLGFNKTIDKHENYLKSKNFEIQKRVEFDGPYHTGYVVYATYLNTSVLIVIDDSEVRKFWFEQKSKRK